MKKLNIDLYYLLNSLMKIGIAIWIIALVITCISAFNFIEEKKAAATVEQKEGIYIFMFSKPVAQYEYLGTVKKGGLVWSGKPEEMFNIMLRRCKKDYPQANGIIFTNVGMYEADCIKFKE